MQPSEPRVLAAVATPFDARLRVDTGLLGEHCRALLGQGCEGLVLFGSTGESASLTVSERKQIVAALVTAGIDPGVLIVGAGFCAAADVIELSREAATQGCGAVLIHPPFFFKELSEEGLLAFYRLILDESPQGMPRVVLYHYPQMLGISVTPAFAARLRVEYGDRIAGYKDSSGEFDNALALRRVAPALRLYVGNEGLLIRIRAQGGSGCISATANVQAGAIAAVLRASTEAERDERQGRVAATRRAFDGAPLIPGVKAVLARLYRTPAWSRTRPPLIDLDAEASSRLWARFSASRSAVP